MAPTASSSTAAARNKLVIRRLPPTLPEEIFWKAVSPWITAQTCLWKRYIKGSEGTDGRPTFSRAYVLMSGTEHLVAFHRGFDGHVFKAKSGTEYQAVVEFAPYQKTPYKAKVKTDTRQGTIDDDPDYKSFMESLSAPAVKPVLETSVAPPQPTSTPLLDHLRETKAAKAKSKAAKAKSAAATTKAETSKEAALAAVSKAAAKRAPQDASGVVLVAGKGRGVTVQTTPAEGEAGTSEGKKSKRNRKPKNGHTPSGEGGSSVKAVSDSKNGAKSVSENKAAIGGKQGLEQGKAAPTPVNASGTGGERGGKGGGRGRGRGRGDAHAGGQGRSAHDTVMSILTKNADGGTPGRGGRGGSRGGRGGRGGGNAGNQKASGVVNASEARIDA